MTFKDLKKRVTLELTQQQSKLSERLYNKPFGCGHVDIVFHTKDIEAAIEKGRKYDPDYSDRVYLDLLLSIFDSNTIDNRQ